MIYLTYAVSLPEIPLKGFAKINTFKAFFNDVGLLRVVLELTPSQTYTDQLSLYKGVITENYVANQLISNNHSLYYWLSEGEAEVDFIISTIDGVIPIEVKSSENTQAKSLNTYINKYHPKYAIRVSTKNFAYDEQKKIKTVPLYAVFCIKE